MEEIGDRHFGQKVRFLRKHDRGSSKHLITFFAAGLTCISPAMAAKRGLETTRWD
jgi:hypothetical protein